MTLSLANKRILLGITGSIAAYKSAELTRLLRDAGADVRVVMTAHAKQFITPMTLQALSGHPVHDELFDLQMENAMGHIQLAKWADVIVIAPASADCLSRLATGAANDLLTTLCLATRAPVMIAPAMNQAMWLHSLTQANCAILQTAGYHVLEPDAGLQACGDVGPGRMVEPQAILARLGTLFQTGLLTGVRVLMTAGPTQEAMDPIRYFANHSSGKMGFALMEAIQEAGATVTMVHGPVSCAIPSRGTCIPVKSAQEMHAAVMQQVAQCDMFIAVAAVSDYRPETVTHSKIHKSAETLSLNLVRNPDIVAEVGALASPPFIVGFTIETEELVERARAKRIRKKMDMIVANAFSEAYGMGREDNEVIVISKNKEITLPRMGKLQLARELVAQIAGEYTQQDELEVKG
jgi:phosphopantothenoylcysteine decarboxylase/phosphopantothenate--cysteine ligase